MRNPHNRVSNYLGPYINPLNLNLQNPTALQLTGRLDRSVQMPGRGAEAAEVLYELHVACIGVHIKGLYFRLLVVENILGRASNPTLTPSNLPV